MVKRLLTVLFLLLCGHAYAQNAADCIQLGATPKAQSLTNTCSEPVIVFWCHDLNQASLKDGLCGETRRYFRKNTMLKPGQTESNPYSHPLGAHLSYGACFGSYNSFEIIGEDGSYLCKGDHATATEISTSSAPDRAAACKQARELAASNGIPGECDCATKGKVFICHVAAATARQARSFEDYATALAKGKIREALKCKEDDAACLNNRSRNVPTGVRD